MRSFTVVVGTEDEKEIFLGHPGDSRKFLKVKIYENGDVNILEVIENKAKDYEEKQHGDPNKRKRVLEIIGDTDFILTRRNSPNLIKIAKESSIQPILFRKISDIKEAIDFLKENFEKFYSIKENRKRGERYDVMIV